MGTSKSGFPSPFEPFEFCVVMPIASSDSFRVLRTVQLIHVLCNPVTGQSELIMSDVHIVTLCGCCISFEYQPGAGGSLIKKTDPDLCVCVTTRWAFQREVPHITLVDTGCIMTQSLESPFRSCCCNKNGSQLFCFVWITVMHKDFFSETCQQNMD